MKWVIVLLCVVIVKCELGLDWTLIERIPSERDGLFDFHFGVAGPITGSSNGVFVVAGGSNFPTGPGWRNGVKFFRDDVYLLDKAYNWVNVTIKIPFGSIAYALSLQYDDDILVVGGQGSPTGTSSSGIELYSHVFKMRYNTVQRQFVYEKYSDLPFGAANMCGEIYNNHVYIATDDSFLSLDLKFKNSTWKKLQTWPGPPRNYSLSAVVDGYFYLFSGSLFTNGNYQILQDTYRYSFSASKWEKLSDSPVTVMAGTGGFVNGKEIFFVGRQIKNIFLELDEVLKKRNKSGPAQWIIYDEYLKAIFDNHQGYPSDILTYNTETDTWGHGGTFQGPATVTTNKAIWNNEYIIAGGEIRPGIRSPNIYRSKRIN